MPRVVLSCLLTLLSSRASAAVVINEVLPDTMGADSGNEWFELYNNGATPVTLTGWTFQSATSTYVERYSFPIVDIDPGAYLVVGGEHVAFADLNLPAGVHLSMGNATSSGDAVRLLDDTGAVVDTVLYGPDNSDGFAEDDGSIPGVVGPEPDADVSIARVPDGVDTDSSAADFVALDSPTPGAPNESAAPSCTSAADAAGVVINEFLPDAVGADPGWEWVELYNPTGGAVDISGWTIHGGTAAYTNFGTIPDGTTIDAGGYLVAGESEMVPDRDVIAAGFILGNATTNADAVQLRDCSDTPVDTVVYGFPNEDDWLDDTGAIATSTAPDPAEGMPLGRVEDGVDTDQSFVDFKLYGAKTPGEPNTDMVLFLSGPLERGELVTIEADGANPGDNVVFLRGSGAGPGPCPPVLSGTCLSIVNPAVLGSQRADALGNAELTFALPPSAPLVDLALQAVQLDGADVLTSDVVVAPILP